MITANIKKIHDSFVGAEPRDVSEKDIEIMKKAYIQEGVEYINICIPNFENAVIAGPEASAAAVWFRQAVSGYSGLDGLGIAIQKQFECMDNFDIVFLINDDTKMV